MKLDLSAVVTILIRLISVRYLITGGAGFIGSYLVRRLARLGETIVLARPASTRPQSWKSNSEGVRILPVDVCDEIGLVRVLSDVRPTAVCHLAAAGLTRGVSPAVVTATNVLGTRNLLAAIQATASVERAVFAGSWYEYGAASIDDPIRSPKPTSVYGISKFTATQLVEKYAAESGLSVLVVRPFQVFGPDEPLHRLIPDVLRQAADGDSVQLQHPNVRRDWVYVEDVAEALELALVSNGSGNVDIGTGVSTSVRELVGRVLTLAGGVTSDVEEASSRMSGESDDARLSGTADIRRAQELVGWTAKHDLATGLQKTVEWYRRHWQRVFKTLPECIF